MVAILRRDPRHRLDPRSYHELRPMSSPRCPPHRAIASYSVVVVTYFLAVYYGLVRLRIRRICLLVVTLYELDLYVIDRLFRGGAAGLESS